jgi:hypothetical protein
MIGRNKMLVTGDTVLSFIHTFHANNSNPFLVYTV